jgi:hypothetical protein
VTTPPIQCVSASPGKADAIFSVAPGRIGRPGGPENSCSPAPISTDDVERIAKPRWNASAVSAIVTDSSDTEFHAVEIRSTA